MKASLLLIHLAFAVIFFSTGCQKTELEVMRDPPPSPNLPGAPLIPERSILRPFFQTTLGNVDAGSSVGTAFGAEIDGDDRTFVLTALSILGPASGLTRQAAPAELSEIFKSITLGDAFGSFDGVLSASGFIGVLESSPFDQTSLAGDIVAISMPNKTRASKLRLSADHPAKGDSVWLSAAMYAGAPPSQRQHAATVTGEDEHGNIVYEFENNKLTHQGTVGAPILNKKGDVVAIHLGGSQSMGTLTGFANPASRFLSYLEAAVRSSTMPTNPPGTLSDNGGVTEDTKE